MKLTTHRLTYYAMLLYACLCLTAMAPMGIGAAILATCILFDRRGPQGLASELGELFRTAPIKSYLAASFAVILACLISLLSNEFYPLQLGGHTAKIHWLKDPAKMIYLLLPVLWALGWLRLSQTERDRVYCAWIVTFGILSSVGMVQFFTGWPRAQPNPTLPGFFHTVLFLGHHLSVASIWIFPFFAALEITTQTNLLKTVRIPKAILYLFLFFGLFTLVFTYSRTLWVGLPLGIGFWILAKFPRQKAIASILVLGLAGSLIPSSSIFHRRVSSLMGVHDRIELWKANFHFFEARPIFGVGFGKSQELSAYYFQQLHPEQSSFFTGHAHNIYLELLAATGIAGFLAWCFWFFSIFRLLYTVRRSSPSDHLPAHSSVDSSAHFSTGVICALIVFLINGFTQVNFWEGKVLHQVMWITGMILAWNLTQLGQGQGGKQLRQEP